MEMKMRFPGGERVEAQWEGLSLATDQNGSAPSPFHLFLASLGTCAGFYVVSFLNSRKISTDGLEMTERIVWNNNTHMVEKIQIDITLPSGFPEQYKDAVLRAARTCTVKKHLEQPPAIELAIVP